MKNFIIFFCLFISDAIYSQANCGLGYDFTSSGSSIGCNYTFTPTTPGGSPSIAYYEWIIASSGTYGRECETLYGNPLYYQFCFYGNHDVTMIIYFDNGSRCKVTHTINVSCAYSLPCNPNPTTTSVPNPTVEVTFIDPAASCVSYGDPISGCASIESCDPPCGAWINSCSWHWAVRVPESQYNCDLFTYKMEYTLLEDCYDTPTTVCEELDPGRIYCLFAKIGTPVYIVAYGNHCCLPANYKRAFSWNPSVLSGTLDPDGYFGHCVYRCTIWYPYHTSCVEDEYEMDQTTGIPTLSCFRGRVPKSSNLSSKEDNNPKTGYMQFVNQGLSQILETLGDRQQIMIYDIQGNTVFNGMWNFDNSISLRWPDNFSAGLYFVKFQDLKKTVKLYKFD